MGLINLEDLKPDMLLEEDVLSRNGRTLLRSGNRITEKHIGIFKAWGVTEAAIEGMTKDDAAASAAESIDPQILEKAREQTQTYFLHSGTTHPLLEELFRVSTFRQVQKIQDL